MAKAKTFTLVLMGKRYFKLFFHPDKNISNLHHSRSFEILKPNQGLDILSF